jgi:hypothetical protein
MEAWRQGRDETFERYGHHGGLDKKCLLMEDSCSENVHSPTVSARCCFERNLSGNSLNKGKIVHLHHALADILVDAYYGSNLQRIVV